LAFLTHLYYINTFMKFKKKNFTFGLSAVLVALSVLCVGVSLTSSKTSYVTDADGWQGPQFTLDKDNTPSEFTNEYACYHDSHPLSSGRFYYEQVKKMTNSHCSIKENGYIIKDLTRGMANVTASFNGGGLYILTGNDYDVFTTSQELISGQPVSVCGDYFKLLATSDIDLISFKVCYSCYAGTTSKHEYVYVSGNGNNGAYVCRTCSHQHKENDGDDTIILEGYTNSNSEEYEKSFYISNQSKSVYDSENACYDFGTGDTCSTVNAVGFSLYTSETVQNVRIILGLSSSNDNDLNFSDCFKLSLDGTGQSGITAVVPKANEDCFYDCEIMTIASLTAGLHCVVIKPKTGQILTAPVKIGYARFIDNKADLALKRNTDYRVCKRGTMSGGSIESGKWCECVDGNKSTTAITTPIYDTDSLSTVIYKASSSGNYVQLRYGTGDDIQAGSTLGYSFTVLSNKNITIKYGGTDTSVNTASLSANNEKLLGGSYTVEANGDDAKKPFTIKLNVVDSSIKMDISNGYCPLFLTIKFLYTHRGGQNVNDYPNSENVVANTLYKSVTGKALGVAHKSDVPGKYVFNVANVSSEDTQDVSLQYLPTINTQSRKENVTYNVEFDISIKVTTDVKICNESSLRKLSVGIHHIKSSITLTNADNQSPADIKSEITILTMNYQYSTGACREETNRGKWLYYTNDSSILFKSKPYYGSGNHDELGVNISQVLSTQNKQFLFIYAPVDMTLGKKYQITFKVYCDVDLAIRFYDPDLSGENTDKIVNITAGTTSNTLTAKYEVLHSTFDNTDRIGIGFLMSDNTGLTTGLFLKITEITITEI